MKPAIYKKSNEGFITVFLSLILLLILSLIITVIEGARITTAKIMAERALTTAMDSVLAEYYQPLLEEYHILGLEASYGKGEVITKDISDKLNEYIRYTLQPGQNLPDISNRTEFYNTSVNSIQLTGYTGLMDYDGEIFINQCVEYMKYKELGNGMELLLDKLSILEEPKKVSYLYEEKLTVEKQLVEIDEGILSLMQLLDGVSTDSKGIRTNKDGSLKTVTEYIKKICYGTATKERVGIHNDSIYQALQSQYINPSGNFLTIVQSLDSLEEAKNQLDKLEKDIGSRIESMEKAQEVLEQLYQSLSEAKGRKEDTKGIESSIEECEKGIEQLQDNLKEDEEKQSYYRQIQLDAIEIINREISCLYLLITPMTPLITDAIATIEGILKASDRADPLIREYEEILKEQGSSLSKDIYESFEEGLSELKRYQSGNEDGYNFPYMIEILRGNASTISFVEGYLKEVEMALGQEDYQNARVLLNKAGETLTSYRIEGLFIDYSSLVIRKVEDMDPLETIRSMMEEGMLGMVVDSTTLSEAELGEELLPSITYALAGSEDADFSIFSYFEDMVIGGNYSGIGSLFQNISNMDFSSLLEDSVNQVAEQILLWEYLQEHFYSYTSKEEELRTRKPSTLIYEQEYLLSGKRSDRDNLSSIVSKIILLRTLLNFTTVLGDKAKLSEAKTLATALVGFTGLPILVSITQTIIMVLLAFAEALVDTSALLMGKEVPLLKDKIKYSTYEFINLNGVTIRAKAAAYPDQNSRFALSYKNYVSAFLFIKNKKDLSYRSMDLIQENIRIRYEDNFFIKNCIFGFDSNVIFTIKPKFISLSFIQKYLNSNIKNYEYMVQTEYSY